MTEFTIFNARIHTGRELIEGGITVNDGKIVKIGKKPKLDTSCKVINANGNLILPGLVDLHVHFRDPGYTHKEDFFTGSSAAVAGGVTTVVDEPNNNPVIDSVKSVKLKKKKVKRKSLVDYTFSVNLTSDNFLDLHLFKEEGIRCYTVFDELGGKSTGMRDTGILHDALCNVKAMNGLALLNCRESDIIKYDINGLQNDGSNSLEDYNDSFTPVAEAIGSVKHMLLANDIGVSTHLREVSTWLNIQLLRKFKKGKITAEARPDHLFLNQENDSNLGPFVQQWTPIRKKRDSLELFSALNDGTIDVVSSDHATHTLDEKKSGWDNIWNSPPGLPAIETMLPLLLTKVNQGDLFLDRLVEVCSVNPSKILEIYPKKGCIQVGSDADFVMIDLKQKKKIKGSNLHGKTKWTPFEGKEVRGVPTMTFVRGILCYENGEITCKPGHGEFL